MILQTKQFFSAKPSFLLMSALFLSLLLGATDGLVAQPTCIVSQQTEVALSNGDRIRGWSWDGRTASYIATEDDGRGGTKSVLYVRPFDGQNFGSVSFRYDNFSKSDRIRGWSWNGREASYIATEDDGRGGKKSILYVRPFDGRNFGPVSFEYDNFSKSDRIRGWSWDGKWAVYVGLWQGKAIIYSCSFDGRVFGPVQEGVLEMASGTTVSGYQSGLRNGSVAFLRNGKAYLTKQFPR